MGKKTGGCGGGCGSGCGSNGGCGSCGGGSCGKVTSKYLQQANQPQQDLHQKIVQQQLQQHYQQQLQQHQLPQQQQQQQYYQNNQQYNVEGQMQNPFEMFGHANYLPLAQSEVAKQSYERSKTIEYLQQKIQDIQNAIHMVAKDNIALSEWLQKLQTAGNGYDSKTNNDPVYNYMTPPNDISLYPETINASPLYAPQNADYSHTMQSYF